MTEITKELLSSGGGVGIYDFTWIVTATMAVIMLIAIYIPRKNYMSRKKWKSKWQDKI